MKMFYRLSCNAPSKPFRLIASTVLAFVVMVFINGFIGSMGGFPAFIAFLTVFYLLRSVTGAGNRIMHHLAMTSRRELFILFFDYIAGYLFLWSLIRLALLFSRVNGWGHINGASALDYIQRLLATPMLEMWAYFFVGILMFAFVLSLFPLVVIRRPGTWVVYALLDGAVFSLLCEIFSGLCRLYIGEKPFGRSICLIDYLLLCGGLAGWKRILYMAGMLVFTLVVGVFAFLFADHVYGPKRGRLDVDTSAWTPGTSKKTSADIRILCRNTALASIGVALFGGIMAIVLFGPQDKARMYEKVAEYLTEDDVLGPMVYGGRIYIPTGGDLTLRETGSPQGYLAHRDEDCGSRFYELTVANVLYTAPEASDSHVEVHGAVVGRFVPAGEIEEQEAWRENSVFLLWDEDWVRESAYTHEPTGYMVCEPAFVEGLERRFGQVVYRESDFEDYDAYFSLYGYEDIEHAMLEELTPGNWVGCILVKDNKFYYGSRENPIGGVLLQELLDILGGYRK